MIEVCKGEGNIGVKFGNSIISLVKGKVIKIKAEKCIPTEFRIDKDIIYKDLRILLPSLPSELKYLKLIYLIKGEVSHELIYYKNNVEIHIDSKLKDIKLEDKVTFTRFCGNYGLLFPHFCIGNETFAIFGNKKEDVIKAYEELKGLTSYIRKILLELS